MITSNNSPYTTMLEVFDLIASSEPVIKQATARSIPSSKGKKLIQNNNSSSSLKRFIKI